MDRAVVDVEGGCRVAEWRYTWPRAELLARHITRARPSSVDDPGTGHPVPSVGDRSVADRSRGWDDVALELIAHRHESRIGADVIRAWTHTLPRGASVLDLGCGSGVPVTDVLEHAGCRVWGIDASPRLISAFRARFPDVPAACEPAEHSTYFDRTFDAVVAVGLLFLLPESVQRRLIMRVASAIEPGGQFLFTAPRLPCTWTDAWTGQPSRSLGWDEYRAILGEAGLILVGTHADEGDNHYLQALKPAACAPEAGTP